ncbi:MAG: hypothetical protein ABII27_01840 [bacterium]
MKINCCYFIILLFVFNAFSCKATYEKQYLETSIKKLCLEEYKTDVEVRVNGKTVYADLAFDSIIFGLEGLSQNDIETLSNVMFGLSRVVLSCSEDLNFIVLKVRGIGISRKYITLIRYIQDIKRFQLGDISQNEYFNRLIIKSTVTEQEIVLESTVRYFREYFQKKNTNPLTLADSNMLEDTLKQLYLNNQNVDVKLNFIETAIYENSKNNYYVYFKTEESYFSDSSINIYRGEYISKIQYSDFLFSVENIYPIRFLGVNGNIIINDLPPEAQTNDITKLPWKIIDLYPDISLTDFLSMQISQRIPMLIESSSPLRDKLTIDLCEGKFTKNTLEIPKSEKVFYLPKEKEIRIRLAIKSLIKYIPFYSKIKKLKPIPDINGKFLFNFNINPNHQINSNYTLEEIRLLNENEAMNHISRNVRYILNRYDFFNYGEIHFVNQNLQHRFIAMR